MAVGATAVTDIFWLTVVALLWGGTNPLIKRGGQVRNKGADQRRDRAT